MLRLLRWGTFLVLIAVVTGVLLSYPILRDRFFAPTFAAPVAAIEVLPKAAVTTQPATTGTPTVIATFSATISATATMTVIPTVLPTSAPTRAQGVIIQAPSPTVPLQPSTIPTSTAQSIATSTPVALATTSLLPAINTATATNSPTVKATNPTTTTIITASVGIAVPVTPSTPTPALIMQGPAAPVGEKGYEPPLASASVATEATPTPIVLAVPPTLPTPFVVTTVEVSPAISTTSIITPMVVITLELTPQTGTPITPSLPLGPIANTNGPLYGGPDLNAAIVGQITAGEQLLIIGIYTEGTWYLLANGMWLPGNLVDNAPLTLPLVFPTVTPIPTNTPTITPTPLPTATLVGSVTPSPTPTSLEVPVCDCSGDHLDCLGNIFANRAAAQGCFEYCFRQTGLDIHLLDPNLNGVACENLP